MLSVALLLLRSVLWLVCLGSTIECARRVLGRVVGDGAYSLALPVALGAAGYLLQPLTRLIGVGPGVVLLGLGAAVTASLLPAPPRELRRGPGDIAGLGVSALIVAVLATTNLWDRRFHIALVGNVARGVAPLEHPAFPGERVDYHAAFDFIAAGFLRVTGLDPHSAVEAAQLLSLVAVVAGTRHLLRGSPVWALPLVCAGPLAIATAAVPLAQFVPTEIAPFDDVFRAVPPNSSGLFQPAFCLGWAMVPVLLRVVEVKTAPARVLLAVLTLFLSDMNVVFFALGGLGLACALAVDLVQTRSRTTLLGLGLLAGSLLLWLGCGSFRPRSGIVPGSFFGDDNALGLVVFLPGTLVALALFAHAAWRRALSSSAITLAVMTLAGLLIGVFFIYSNTWDIVKFLHVSSVTGAILLVLLIKDFAPFQQRLIAVPFVVVGTLWLLRFGPLNGTVFREYLGDSYDDAAMQILGAIGDDVPASECVFTPALVMVNVGIRAPGDDPANYVGVIQRLDVWQQRHQQWVDTLNDPTADRVRAFGCRYVFVPDPLFHADANGRLFGELEPVDAMLLAGARWTLYRYATK